MARLRVGAGLIDAALASLATFVIGVYAVAHLDGTSLGIYGLAFAAFQLAAQVPADLVFAGAELTLIGRTADHQLGALRTTLRHGIVVVAVGALAATAVLLALVANRGHGAIPLAVGAGAAAIFSPLQDHLRRMLHQTGRSYRAVIVSTVQLVSAAGLIVAMSILGIDPEYVPFTALTAANIVSITAGYLLRGVRGGAATGDELRLTRLLRFGSWLVVGSLAMRAAQFGSMALIAALAGLEVVGWLESTRVLSQPLVVLATGLITIVRPQIVLALRSGRPASALLLHRLFVTMLLVSGAGLALVAGPDWALNPLPSLFPAAFRQPGLLAAMCVATAGANVLVAHAAETLALDRARIYARITATGAAVWIVVAAVAAWLGAEGFSLPLAMGAYALVSIALFRQVLAPAFRGEIRPPDVLGAASAPTPESESSGSPVRPQDTADVEAVGGPDATVAMLRQRLRMLCGRALRPVPASVAMRAATSGGIIARLGNVALVGRTVTVTSGPAQGLVLDPGPGEARYGLGTVEPEVQASLVEQVKAGSVVFDVGANVGFHTLLAARLVGSAGQVVAFEPVESIRKVLEANVVRNNLDNVVIVGSAVDTTSGSAPLWVTAWPGGHGLASAGRSPDAVGQITVDTVSLDNWIAAGRTRPPDLVKIDVEGAEIQVLDGMADLLSTHQPVLIVELDAETPELLTTALNAVRARLGSKGYLLRQLSRSDADSDWCFCHIVAVPVRKPHSAATHGSTPSGRRRRGRGRNRRQTRRRRSRR